MTYFENSKNISNEISPLVLSPKWESKAKRFYEFLCSLFYFSVCLKSDRRKECRAKFKRKRTTYSNVRFVASITLCSDICCVLICLLLPSCNRSYQIKKMYQPYVTFQAIYAQTQVNRFLYYLSACECVCDYVCERT